MRIIIIIHGISIIISCADVRSNQVNGRHVNQKKVNEKGKPNG